MRNIKKSILRGTSVLGLIFSVASVSSAMNRASTDPEVMAWRRVARKNFIEGFCVAQNLNAQGIVIQAGQQIDQATVNAFKNAVGTCKSGNKNTAAPAPAQTPSPGPTPASSVPVIN